MAPSLKDLGKSLPNPVKDTVKRIQDLHSKTEYEFTAEGDIDIQELAVENQRALERNLVWIFASPRSGTTWLATQLLSHNTRCIDEPRLGAHLGMISYRKEQPFRLLDEFGSTSNYFFSYEHSKVWGFYLRKIILHRIYAQFQDLTRKIIVKEPNGSLAADIIAKCMPNSKIIVILRDGRDAIDSLMDSLGVSGWRANVELTPLKREQRLNFIKNQSHQWNLLMGVLMRAYESHDEQKRLMIKYEDLRNQTFDVVKSIYCFIGVDIDDNALHKLVETYSFERIPNHLRGPGKVTRFATPGKWKENFKDDEKELAQSIMGERLTQLGYNNS